MVKFWEKLCQDNRKFHKCLFNFTINFSLKSTFILDNFLLLLLNCKGKRV